nr:hypothetical protein [Verrucomicrobium spinosum]
MLQISQFRLPIDHSDDDLKKSVCKALETRPDRLGKIKIKQRAVDARKKNEVLFCYTLLVEVPEEERVLRRVGKPGRIEKAPDERYLELDRLTAEAAANDKAAKPKIVVVGTAHADSSAACFSHDRGTSPSCWSGARRRDRAHGM